MGRLARKMVLGLVMLTAAAYVPWRQWEGVLLPPGGAGGGHRHHVQTSGNDVGTVFIAPRAERDAPTWLARKQSLSPAPAAAQPPPWAAGHILVPPLDGPREPREHAAAGSLVALHCLLAV